MGNGLIERVKYRIEDYAIRSKATLLTVSALTGLFAGGVLLSLEASLFWLAQPQASHSPPSAETRALPRDFPLSIDGFARADSATMRELMLHPIYDTAKTDKGTPVVVQYFPRGYFTYKKGDALGFGRYSPLSGDTATVYEEIR